MQTLLKHIITLTYKPLLVKYLSRTRMYRYKDIRLAVPPEIFHPGFFFSTHLLLRYLNRYPLKEIKLLELGCGSGLISISAAKQGATVTATDINPVAVEALKKNSKKNKVKLHIIQSDLFNLIPKQPFDLIAINPPYYKKKPLTAADHAWFCGENGEYYSGLFDGLSKYIHPETVILMVLIADCDMDMINGFAAKNGYALNCVYTKKNILEKNLVFKIEKKT